MDGLWWSILQKCWQSQYCWMVNFMEHPIYKWMRIGGTPMVCLPVVQEDNFPKAMVTWRSPNTNVESNMDFGRFWCIVCLHNWWLCINLHDDDFLTIVNDLKWPPWFTCFNMYGMFEIIWDIPCICQYVPMISPLFQIIGSKSWVSINPELQMEWSLFPFYSWNRKTCFDHGKSVNHLNWWSLKWPTCVVSTSSSHFFWGFNPGTQPGTLIAGFKDGLILLQPIIIHSMIYYPNSW